VIGAHESLPEPEPAVLVPSAATRGLYRRPGP
jgi:hypothetical protein